MNRSLISELLEDATSKRILPAVGTGIVAAAPFIILQVSLAAMIYSGSLSALSARAAGLALCGGCLICICAALTSSFQGTVSGAQDAPAAVLSTVAVTIAATLGEQAPMEAKFMTVAAVLTLSAVLTGAVFIIIGKFHLANLLRFMPYPVLGGFLAGTGWVLVAGGVSVMCGVPVSPETFGRLVTPETVIRWLPGVAFGVALFAITRRHSHFLILPGSLAAVAALFYVLLPMTGMSLDGARAAGFLVSGVPIGRLFPPFAIGEIALIDWSVVWQQLPGMFSVALVTVVGMLLNMSGVELAAGEELDMNREFVSGGVGNCLAGVGGCFPGYPVISLTFLGVKTGARSRYTGLVVALIAAGVLVFGGRALGYFPTALLGGMLVLVGSSLIHEWLLTSRKGLPWPDYLVVVVIFLVIAARGYLEGVAVGLVATVIFFVVRFSRVPVVEIEFSALDRRSSRARSVPHRKVLSATGERVRGYALSGYIFFGSATTLVESLKGALRSEPHPDFILLDFARVSGLDVSAVKHFHRLALNASAARTTIVVTALPDHFVEALKRGLSDGVMNTLVFFTDLDRGLEWCEDQLIQRTLSNREHRASMREALFHQSVDDVMAHLEQQERFEQLLDGLAPWLEKQEHPAGSSILAKGETPAGLRLLTWGTASEIDPDTGSRVRSLSPGSVIAATAAFASYTATTTVRADSNCRTALLSPDARVLLELENPSLAIALHGFLVRSGCG
ncbi:MAG: SulP family inorganic anion transporter [Acidobacteriota bacterium]